MDEELERIRQRKQEALAARLAALREGVTRVTDLTFPEMVREHPRLVIDFSAEWCGPCQRLGPVVEGLAVELAGTVAFATCDVDEAPGVASTFGIQVVPTLVFFSHGRAVGRLTGAVSADVLRANLRRVYDLW
ncbi:thioredoxin 1 [Methanofollis sp. W23]|uniref:thioredoxin family protein n=1 Tax=Methanofollis sp. W23 TaxID=2817849 RepID=UPI001AEBA5EE|nr:thioredoxin domain-containing protein [Methanofollis sp. W23]MBP2147047.1 thioredoxin 1 [Methanofollis sp. W23]